MLPSQPFFRPGWAQLLGDDEDRRAPTIELADLCLEQALELLCTAIGPPLGGMLIDLLGGLPMTATVYFLLVYSVAVPMVGILVYKYAKRPEKGCMAQPPADEVLSGEGKAEALLQKAEKAA